MIISAVQLAATADVDQSIQQAVDNVLKAVEQGADVVILPEVFQFRGKLTVSVKKRLFEPIPGPTTERFQSLAKHHSVYIVLGSIYERCADDDQYCFNTQVIINKEGTIIARYRKRHLFRSRVKEQDIDEARNFRAGTEPIVAHIDKAVFGCSICYDLRFPHVFRDNRQRGANIMLVPSAFTHQTGLAHWHVLLRARAIENLSYVVAPNQFGIDERGIRCYGHSLIIDPWGTILQEAEEDKSSIISTSVDFDKLEQLRYLLPFPE
jgi:predicted amidohydrolase